MNCFGCSRACTSDQVLEHDTADLVASTHAAMALKSTIKSAVVRFSCLLVGLVGMVFVLQAMQVQPLLTLLALLTVGAILAPLERIFLRSTRPQPIYLKD